MTLGDRRLKRVPQYSGRDAEASSDMDHFGRCLRCGPLVDMCDLSGRSSSIE
jgi:hypothetical protein